MTAPRALILRLISVSPRPCVRFTSATKGKLISHVGLERVVAVAQDFPADWVDMGFDLPVSVWVAVSKSGIEVAEAF